MQQAINFIFGIFLFSSFLQYFGLEGTGSVGIEVKKVLGDCVEIESKSFHKLWSCGSASTRGTNLDKTGDNAMQQVTNARHNSNVYGHMYNLLRILIIS